MTQLLPLLRLSLYNIHSFAPFEIYAVMWTMLRIEFLLKVKSMQRSYFVLYVLFVF